MVDVTGRPIENGDLLLEIYNNGKRVFIHVAHAGFSAQYVRTIQCNINQHGNETRLFKSHIKPKGVIIITEEQFINYVNYEAREFIDDSGMRIHFNSLLEFSREYKIKK